MPQATQPNLTAVLDALGQAVLVFDDDGQLVAGNDAAQSVFGNDLRLLRAEGWPAAVTLLGSHGGERGLDDALAEAQATGRLVRFHAANRGEVVPCSVAVARGGDAAWVVVAVEVPDWSVMTELMDRFMQETRDAVESTQGHADLILLTLKRARPDESLEQLGRRVGGFARLISTHMLRTHELLGLVARLKDVRLGRLRARVDAERRKLRLDEFVEDFLETLDGSKLVDPETDEQDFRARIRVDIPARLTVDAPPAMLAVVLRDLIRNAIMYSMRGTPITLSALADDEAVHLDVSDEGYGIRAGEYERVFAPFQRGRQPQIMGEFGYGLSLFLCKHEVEAMNGRLWFTSEEGVRTTFSLKLPLWNAAVDARASDSSSSR